MFNDVQHRKMRHLIANFDRSKNEWTEDEGIHSSNQTTISTAVNFGPHRP